MSSHEKFSFSSLTGRFLNGLGWAVFPLTEASSSSFSREVFFLLCLLHANAKDRFLHGPFSLLARFSPNGDVCFSFLVSLKKKWKCKWHTDSRFSLFYQIRVDGIKCMHG
jgi:hypothetical protein